MKNDKSEMLAMIGTIALVLLIAYLIVPAV